MFITPSMARKNGGIAGGIRQGACIRHVLCLIIVRNEESVEKGQSTIEVSIGQKEALVVTADGKWAHAYRNALLEQGFEVHTAWRADEAFGLLRKYVYGVIIIDDSLTDSSVIELGLTVRDIAVGQPALFAAAPSASRFGRVQAQCGAVFAGERGEVLNKIGALADPPE